MHAACVVTPHEHDPGDACERCGHETDPSDRHVRFTLPDAVLGLPDREQTAGSWMSHDTADESMMMQVPGAGNYVRVLLPIRLDDGTSITYGTWLLVEPAALHEAFSLWWSPDYARLHLSGRLANDVPPGGVLGTAVEAVVRDEDHTPYVDSSDDELVARLLSRPQPPPAYA